MVIQDLYRDTVNALRGAGIEASTFEAAELVTFFCHVTRETLYSHPETEVLSEDADLLLKALTRRMSGEPLQYVLGKWDFYGLTFNVGPGVLIPRPDTEVLVEQALKLMADIPSPRFMDLCSGSGCIAAAIAHNRPDSKGVALEVSDKAYKYLKKNMLFLRCNNVAAVMGDIFYTDPAEFFPQDCIVSNPPYIVSSEIAYLSKEVKSEPRLALDGGTDGLRYYREIIPKWKDALRPGGFMCLEVGYNQASSVRDLMRQNGYINNGYVPDINGINRCVYGFVPG